MNDFLIASGAIGLGLIILAVCLMLSWRLE
jgi:hypothetical protein